MNDLPEQSDLEQMLARRPLTPPSAKLDERMADLFADVALREERAGPRRFASGWAWALRGIAACAALAGVIWMVVQTAKGPGGAPADKGDKDGVVAVNPPVPKTEPPAALEFNPVRIEQSWTDTRPDGLVMVDGDPLRRFSRQTVRHVQLIDDKNNVRIEYTVPQTEVVVMPVRYD